MTANGASLAAVGEVIRRRRTSLLVDPDRPVPDELVDELIGLATWAPNHHRTWPWRFAVVRGEGRHRLGRLVADYEARVGAAPGRIAKAAGKYARAPVVLLVGQADNPNPTRRAEDRDAVAAGIQNLLLGATAAGLASHWATGTWLEDEAVKAFAGLAPADDLVALVYLGWPRSECSTPDRPTPVVTRIGE
ncbi:MAG: nitroreductase family protein [Acidimicrobiia bacterium]